MENPLTERSVAFTLSRLKTSEKSNPLCLECGLCCNGVIFANGQLQGEDNAVRLKELGLRLLSARTPKLARQKFHQPCAAFDCRCGIYSERPQYCRAFECSLLKKFHAGKIEAASALRIVRRALRQAEKVKRLLRELGDNDESRALSVRFRRMQRRMETTELNEASADRFGELTLAVLNLQVLLGREFYP